MTIRNKRRIAILGGGLGGLSAAYHLTNRPDWDKHDEVTVYQMGWRLGGKCASSRGVHDRIEEHGLHVLLGSYENAFAMLRDCYGELNRPAGVPIQTFDDAFKPQDSVVFQEIVDGSLRPWTLTFPRNNSRPGDGGIWPTPADYTTMMIGWLGVGAKLLIRELIRRGHPLLVARTIGSVVKELMGLPSVLVGEGARGQDALTRLARAMRDLRERLGAELVRDDELRRLWILMDLGSSCVIGMLRDRVLTRGFDAIDAEDFRVWMARHGASPLATESALVRAVYDLCFHAADDHRPETGFGAGTALRMTLRFVGAYKGAVGWWMQAGTGEILIAPLYELLRRRGVRFAFFQRVRGLELSMDGTRVARIQLGQQATVSAGVTEYQPLVDTDGLPAWPAVPDWSQLAEGAELEAADIDLEATWSGWQDVATSTLEDGVDFDDVLLAISHAALRPICGELARRLPRWRDLLDGLQSTPTIALQVWSHPPRVGDKPMMNTALAPLTGYGDMSHLLRHEGWPVQPGHVLHVCNRMESVPPPPASDVDFHKREDERAKSIALQWLRDGGGAFVPGATPDGVLAEPTWDALVDPEERDGEARLDAQFWCANVEPTDRYVLSAPGTVGVRMSAEGSGLDNLVLAGTWIRTGLNIGAVEAAVMSGMQASRALTGSPKRVCGERDFG